jgi:GNAT superfamily N-acetyltransferase
LLVADLGGAVVGVLQLSFLPHLTYQGGWRAQIEGVRVSEEVRSGGVGQALLESAIDRARERGCHVVQLTTDRRRPRALQFYLKLGFEVTHDGLKLHLDRGIG